MIGADLFVGATMLQAACTGYFSDSGVVTERVWKNPYQNYDNVGNALLSLFVAVTLNGYSRKSATPVVVCLVEEVSTSCMLCNKCSFL